MTPVGIRTLLTNRRVYIENLVHIENKQRSKVPFLLNQTQAHYHRHHTRRDIICKARQLGFTSFIMASFLVDCLTIPGTVSVVISHKEYITSRFLAKAKAFYASIPDTYMGIPVKPKLHHKSAHEMTFPEVNSVFYIGSAQAPIEERGDTIHNFLGSEVSRWPDPKRILDAIEESVPMEGWMVLESTPWGEDNLFHEYFVRASEGKSVYTAHFYPWWWGEDYMIREGSDLALLEDRGPIESTADETALAIAHGLTIDQIRWRRRKISERRAAFWQEYPEDSVTCFYTSAQAVFDLKRLSELAHACHEPSFHYKGARVWHLPEADASYIIGCDPSEGIRDLAAATVWRADTDNPIHCATYAGLVDPVTFAHKISELGEYYNNALLVVESNGPGIATIASLSSYRRLYRQVDLSTGRETSRPGWRTTEQSKSYAISVFRDLIYDLETHDIEIIRQARNLRFMDPKDMRRVRTWGKLPLKVISTGSDDIIMSAMIALAAIDSAPKIQRGLVGFAPGWDW